ncbi:MAG: bifunctional DedA family/phosphatase PAP2 family protein [Gammaproteobacteria bacterium]
MTLDTFRTVFEWFQAHSAITISIVFITALSESLAVVGLIIPGAILMVIFGALIASGYLEFFPVFTAAVLGAITGDGLSFWLGSYYQQQLKAIWPLKRYPDLFSKGETFFNKHGGKSVLLGRFIGPIRPIIPAIAGMMNMPIHVFLAINIVSALLWAPLYLLPGILLGASFEMASQLAGRFALLLILFIVFLWFSYQLFIFLYRKVTPRTDHYLYSIMNWNTKHPFLANITGSLIDPGQKEIRGLSILTILLLGCSFISAILVAYAMHTGPVQNLNLLVFNLVENIQSPPFDWLLQWLSNLGEREFLFIIVIGISIWLAIYKQWVAIAYVMAAYLVPLAIIVILKWSLSLPNPPVVSVYESFNLPSGHTALAISVYGFIAILFARDFSESLRLSIYIIIAWLVGTIGFTRLYFHTHWLTDVLAGFALGLAWLSLLAIAYRQHHKKDIIKINSLRLLAMFVIFLIASFPYNFSPQHPENEFPQYYVMSQSAWLDTGWQTLDKKRNDLRNKNRHPFTLQWAADIEYIKRYLKENNWQFSDPGAAAYFQWFNPLATIEQLPVLSQVHSGRYDNIRAYKVFPDKNRVMVIRLWSSDTLIQSNNRKVALWVGNVSYLEVKDLFLLRYLHTDNEFNIPLDIFMTEVKSQPFVVKNRTVEETSNWNGKVVLLSQPG